MKQPEWSTVAAHLAAELGRPVLFAADLGRPRADRRTWAAEAEGLGELVVKARRGDWPEEKTRWCAANLPVLAARGYPVPEIVWHGVLSADWHLAVQRRLPGEPLCALDSRLLDALLELVELQADAGIETEARDFAAYQSYVLFDGWDHVWRDAERASEEAKVLCARLRRWLSPVWGLRLPAQDFSHNDLNLTNILGVGAEITGVVDWDEAGLNSRAADLAALVFECERLHEPAVGALLERVAAIAGEGGLRCLVSYRVIAHIAAISRRTGHTSVDEIVTAASRVLDRLDA